MRKLRHYQRYAVSGSGFFHNNPIRKVEFSVKDISASGINITTEIELEEHEVITMDVQVSGNLLPYIKQFKGKVVRKRQHNSIYNYGIRFMELTHKDMIEIDEYLRLNYGSAALPYTSYDTGHDDRPIRQLNLANDNL